MAYHGNYFIGVYVFCRTYYGVGIAEWFIDHGYSFVRMYD